MRGREWTTVTLLVLLMLTVWLGFLFHQSPRFAGSPLGGVLAVSGASLMLVPLAAYWVAKRTPSIKRRLSAWMSMRTLLTVHIYTGLIGAILVLLHTGHKFDSPLGMALTAMVLLVALSGFVGRYLMSHIGLQLREKQARLERLHLVGRQHLVVSEERPERPVEPLDPIAIAVAAIFPLAFSMGMLFPIGIRILARNSADLIPWAWATNGCFSVLGIFSTRITALLFGFSRAMLVGLAVYTLVVACVFAYSRKASPSDTPSHST